MLSCRGIPERVYPFSQGVCRNLYNFCLARSTYYKMERLPTAQELEEKARPYTCLDALTCRCCWWLLGVGPLVFIVYFSVLQRMVIILQYVLHLFIQRWRWWSQFTSFAGPKQNVFFFFSICKLVSFLLLAPYFKEFSWIFADRELRRRGYWKHGTQVDHNKKKNHQTGIKFLKVISFPLKFPFLTSFD